MSVGLAEREAAVLAVVEGIADGWCGGSQPLSLYRLSLGLAGLGEIVELGTHAGKSTTALAMAQQENDGRPVQTVDREEHPRVADNLAAAGVAAWVQRTVGDTHAVGRKWTRPIELLFIDAGHTYAAVRGDIDLWTPHVVERGFVAIHDYPGWEKTTPNGVRHAIHKAVHETLMADSDHWQVVSDREHGSIIVFRRINAAPRVLP